jgi:hypothetical protein
MKYSMIFSLSEEIPGVTKRDQVLENIFTLMKNIH